MAEIADPENTIIIDLKDGPVTIALLPDIAPQHCDRMKQLARSGAYDNVAFHRVIEGFMAQTGDVEFGRIGGDMSMAGRGGSDRPDLPELEALVPMARDKPRGEAEAAAYLCEAGACRRPAATAAELEALL